MRYPQEDESCIVKGERHRSSLAICDLADTYLFIYIVAVLSLLLTGFRAQASSLRSRPRPPRHTDSGQMMF